MPRRAALVFLAAAAVGLAAVLWRAGEHETAVAFPPDNPHPPPAVPARGELCQLGVRMLADADGVRLPLATNGPRGPALDVIVRDVAGREIARGRIPAGYRDGSSPSTRFQPVRADRTVSVCLRRSGAAGSRRRSGELTLTFLRSKPASTLSMLPTIFRRAALFRFGWVGAWTFWTLAALLVLAVPALCAFALARATRDVETAHEP